MALKRITDLTVAGTLTGEELLEVAQVSVTTSINASTISATASDNSFNDSGSGFVAAGFAVGNRVRVTGFGTSTNTLLVGTITALTAGKMTIGGTDGDVITDEAAGNTIHIAKWNSRRALLSDIGIGGGGPSSYDMRFGFTSTPTSTQVLETVPIPRDIEIPANMAASVGIVGTNPTSSFVMTLKDDGSTIGTVTISTGGVFTFATSGGSAKTVLAGSILTLEAPGTVDATVANAVLTILADTV